MNLTEEEAWVVIGAVDVAQMERDCPAEIKLVSRIRAEFLNIDRELVCREMEDNIWAVEAEADPRVKEARAVMEKALNDAKGKLSGRGVGDTPERQRYEELQRCFFEIKGEVAADLRKKAGLA